MQCPCIVPHVPPPPMVPPHVAQVYELLSNNYVEDDDNMFRYERVKAEGEGEHVPVR